VYPCRRRVGTGTTGPRPTRLEELGIACGAVTGESFVVAIPRPFMRRYTRSE